MKAIQDDLSARYASKSFLVRLGAGALVLNLFVVFMGLVSLRQSRRNYEEKASGTAQNLALVLDHFVADTITKADAVLWAVKDEVERVSALPSGGERDLDAYIRREHERVPGLLALRTVNAQGLIDHGSGAEAGPAISVADRDYFIRLREAPDAGLVISKPVVSRIVGQWVLILARRIERPDHGFGGVVYAAIALYQLNKAFADLDLGPHGSVALRDLDLGLIARYPEPLHAGTAVGQKIVSRELQAFAHSGQSSGTYRALTPFDQIQRTFAIRRVSGQPFYILVGLAEQDYLSRWWVEVVQELVEFMLFTFMILAAFWLVYRAWLRQREANDHLEKLLLEVKTLGGLLPICAHCKKIRDDHGYWNQIETYLKTHAGAEFTHGICPDCARDVFPLSSGKHPVI
ncbi:MAG TPA: hypothetical protein VJ486_11825 [Geothrix sp.]|nr:hypothetical protein [Geothrix sp.]